MIKGLNNVEKMIRKVENRQRHIIGLEGQQVTKEHNMADILPAFLHEDTDEKTALESAQEELDNKLAWDFLRSLKIDLQRIMRR